MNLEQFRQEAHGLVDWMVAYLSTIERRPVRSPATPGSIAAQLPAAAPEGPEPFEAIFRDFERIVMPGMTHWQHPRFFAYFPANSSPPSVLAEMLTATLAAQCMLWQTSPAASEMEGRVLDWLRQALGLDAGFVGAIQDSASSATLCAILTARERATGWQANEAGLGKLPPLAVYTSDQAHTSVEKAVRVAGLGRAALRLVPSDERFAMRPDALAELIEADLQAGVKPACVVASLGATGTGGIDPLGPIGRLCRAHDIFLHVDAAWAGSALLLPETRWMIDGIEQADSFVTNPHKWLCTNFDCSAHFVRRPDELVRTLSVMPAFLTGHGTGGAVDYRDWGVPLGRRFRALKLWFVLRSYGISGLQAMLRNHIAWTRELASWIEAAPGFELVSPPVLGLLSFRCRPPGLDEAALDALNRRLIERINDDGRIYLTQNVVRGRFALRFSIGQTTTERRHVEEGWVVIRELAGQIAQELEV
ncbi:MAG: pyridoxal-dependent decarboxylase [Geminicoccaceae bacterium]